MKIWDFKLKPASIKTMRFILSHFSNLIRGLKRNDRLVVFFTLFYLTFFAIYAVIKGNYEFIFYSLVFLLLFELGIYVHKRLIN